MKHEGPTQMTGAPSHCPSLALGTAVRIVSYPIRACAAAGVVVDCRTHLDDPRRVVYFVRGTGVEFEDDFGRLRSVPVLLSRDGYELALDGWYDADELKASSATDNRTSMLPKPLLQHAAAGEPDDSEGGLRGGMDTIRRSMQHTTVNANTAPCELLYFELRIRPWFHAPFFALGHLRPPPSSCAFSIHICHRCLTAFYSRGSLTEHLELCRVRRVPGDVFYERKCSPMGREGRGKVPDDERVVRAFLVDGAVSCSYARNLALLVRSFVESKLLHNEVDVYEFIVVTVSRALACEMLARTVPGSASLIDELVSYDRQEWDGDVVVGIASRFKRTPNHALSCITTLPMFQRCGVGKLLLELAYHLGGARQQRCGCAAFCGTDGLAVDRPFSVSGEALLVSFWGEKVFPHLPELSEEVLQAANRSDVTCDELRRHCSLESRVHLAREDFLHLFLQSDSVFASRGDNGEVVGRLYVRAPFTECAEDDSNGRREAGATDGAHGLRWMTFTPGASKLLASTSAAVLSSASLVERLCPLHGSTVTLP